MATTIQLFMGFLGSMGFGLIFNIGKKNLIVGSFGGLMTWAVYLLMERPLGQSIILSSIVSSAAAQLFAEAMARLLKAPTTVFSIPAVVPLIPGGSLYRTMSAVVFSDWAAFRQYGSATLQTTFGIAIGTSFVAASLYMARQFKKKRT